MRELEERLRARDSEQSQSLVLPSPSGAPSSLVTLQDRNTATLQELEEASLPSNPTLVDSDSQSTGIDNYSDIGAPENNGLFDGVTWQPRRIETTHIPGGLGNVQPWAGTSPSNVFGIQMPLDQASSNTDDFMPKASTTDLNATLSQVSSPSSRVSAATTTFLYKNHIRLQDMTFMAATLANAASLGISQDDYFQDKPSPFFVAAQQVPTLSLNMSFGHIKPHLRPSTLQVSCPHASYLDLIIFPHFREKAMLHATADPCLLDQWALFTDMIAGGLTCWGSLTSGNGRGGGVPWDMRSWEAKPWFLKKWWFLVGREDEDMWETSRWWWQMRGEVLEDG